MSKRVFESRYQDLITPKAIQRVSTLRPLPSVKQQSSSSPTPRIDHDSRRKEQMVKKQAELERRQKAMDKRQHQVKGRTTPVNRRLVEEKAKATLRRKVEQRMKKGYMRNPTLAMKNKIAYQIAKARLDLSSKNPRFAALYKERERDSNTVSSYLRNVASVKEKTALTNSSTNKNCQHEKEEPVHRTPVVLDIIDLTGDDSEDEPIHTKAVVENDDDDDDDLTEDEDGILWPRSYVKKPDQQRVMDVVNQRGCNDGDICM
jgi:hypothetical protein